VLYLHPNAARQSTLMLITSLPSSNLEQTPPIGRSCFWDIVAPQGAKMGQKREIVTNRVTEIDRHRFDEGARRMRAVATLSEESS
jgi:hypothetical protein